MQIALVPKILCGITPAPIAASALDSITPNIGQLFLYFIGDIFGFKRSLKAARPAAHEYPRSPFNQYYPAAAITFHSKSLPSASR